ncbi:16S rRNA (cytidine(1402)-2'-O)-methyltransferase [Roseobacter sp. HKCCA0434]|uniref:16S rRNA (cytidine(1402)-2'-O)-methyltransferase n=1 Tax=Roseobacter sp. HKCCA0434 TaxID=3079297 RepID=UPI002905F644|nr:16S rRNA (cytidine(1402)-2'-O)-methyltransferase [Roseobacter sp. HKCCA0434]
MSPLEPALHLVATPIGSARDITLRALDVLRDADVLAAEDTRTLRRLMEIHGVPLSGRTILPYHDHNGAAMRPRILEALEAGRSVAYASDAGTPLVADPGFQLAREVIAQGYEVRAVPGASAALSALCVAGLPSDRFLFAGFAPPKQSARRTFLAGLAQVEATLIFYESPRRLAATLADMADTLGGARHAAICRELTKRFEETRRGTLADLAATLAEEPAPKGEVVLVVGPPVNDPAAEDNLEPMLREALATMRVRDAADAVAAATGRARRDVYQLALKVQRDD